MMRQETGSCAMVDADRSIIDQVAVIATKRYIPRAQVALAWVLNKQHQIVGATRIHHFEDAVAALSLKLDDNELASLEYPYMAHPVYGH